MFKYDYKLTTYGDLIASLEDIGSIDWKDWNITTSTTKTNYKTYAKDGVHYFDLTVPGAKKDKFKISHDQKTNTVTIDGEYKDGTVIKQKVLFGVELDISTAKAVYEDGILYLSISEKAGLVSEIKVS